jgi:4-hydroxybenzoate polyprenyltransferase
VIPDDPVASGPAAVRSLHRAGPQRGPMTLPRALLVSLRPHQWTKNLLVVPAALVFSKHLFEIDPVLRVGLALVVFCVLSGAVYLVNDLADLERDRLHPRKRFRPLASGVLPVPVARAAAVVLFVAGLGAALLLGPDFFAASLAYVLLNLAYSFSLKNVVILDVIAVSLGFVLRAVAGALAIDVHFSSWLLVITILLALFLSLAKRRHEMILLETSAVEHRRILAEYSPYLLDQMIAVVTASCLTAYAFYTLAPETVTKYQTERLALTIPFVLYGIFRYLYLVHRREGGGSPTDVLLTDRPLLVAVALWAVAVVVIVYGAPGVPVPRGG